MPRAEKVAFIEYILESIKLEMIVSMDDKEIDTDILVDTMIKKLIDRRMKNTILCEGK